MHGWWVQISTSILQGLQWVIINCCICNAFFLHFSIHIYSHSTPLQHTQSKNFKFWYWGLLFINIGLSVDFSVIQWNLKIFKFQILIIIWSTWAIEYSYPITRIRDKDNINEVSKCRALTTKNISTQRSSRFCTNAPRFFN